MTDGDVGKTAVLRTDPDSGDAVLAYQMLKSEVDNYTGRLMMQITMRAQFSGVLAAMCLASMIFVLGVERSGPLVTIAVFAAFVAVLLVVSMEPQARSAFVSPELVPIVRQTKERNYRNAIAYSMNSAFRSMERVYYAEMDTRTLWIVQCIASAICLVSSSGVVML